MRAFTCALPKDVGFGGMASPEQPDEHEQRRNAATRVFSLPVKNSKDRQPSAE